MYADAMGTVASALGVTFERVGVRRGEDGMDDLRRFHHGEGDALVVNYGAGRVDALLAYAARHQLPTLCAVRGGFEAGGLIGYLPSAAEVVARTARYVSLKTARALGLKIPDTLLARADEVIE
jgi:hypothetical protein